MSHAEQVSKETYVQTDESRTMILEIVAQMDPMGHRRKGHEGMSPPLESTTYLTERELIDLDMQHDVSDQIRWLYTPARLRDVQYDIDRDNLKTVSMLARRRSRDGFFTRAVLTPTLRSTSEGVGTVREAEQKKGFSLNPFRRK